MRASAAHSTDTRIPHQPALRPKKPHEPTYTGCGELKMEMVDISDFSGLGVTAGRLIGSISAANFMMIPLTALRDVHMVLNSARKLGGTKSTCGGMALCLPAEQLDTEESSANPNNTWEAARYLQSGNRPIETASTQRLGDGLANGNQEKACSLPEAIVSLPKI
ncbi:hypothetical protein N7541_009272 [Penicillium brevicompactum]|uniref:Uncharacterized protein n=1 Tax=Penicillium brevicompactum TaxID=5074 RepID=A0A9W9QSA9_PENBR|nr:hypothetical protein N7541_009272 [Penicillium brevicompactum]